MPKTSAEITYYADIKERQVQWLWYPFIPYGKITLLQGDPGDGKSTFMINIAAKITIGGCLPGGVKIPACGNVIYQCAEDNAADTIKPRLIEAGADCERVAFISEDIEMLTIDDNRIEEALIETQARLLIFDPIQSYIPADGDLLNAVKMRALLRNLVTLAEKYNCAIVLIGHMNKTVGGKKLYRGLGSIDITAIARSVLMISRDQSNPCVRYMYPVKTSLAFEGNAIKFMFDKENGFQLLGLCELKPHDNEEMVSEKKTKKKETAENRLILMLAKDRMASKQIFAEMERDGISERTVRAAGKKVGIKAKRISGAWYWELPETFLTNKGEHEDDSQ